MNLGDKIAYFRKLKDFSQESLAANLQISRSVIDKWERGQLVPNEKNLVKLAEVFGVAVDELADDRIQETVNTAPDTENIVMPRTPGVCLAASTGIIVLYIILSIIKRQMYPGIIIAMLGICWMCQGFLHIIFSNGVKYNAFSVFSGYNARIQYNLPEVKKMLISVDRHIGISSVITVGLLLVIACMKMYAVYGMGQTGSWFFMILVIGYSLDFTLCIVIYNYRSIEKMISKKIDQFRTKTGYISVFWYMAWIFGMCGFMLLKFSIFHIQNNTGRGIICGLYLLIALIFLSAALFVEQRRTEKLELEEKYRPGKFFWLSNAVAVLCMAVMWMTI